jgi:hypothetical protein
MGGDDPWMNPSICLDLLTDWRRWTVWTIQNIDDIYLKRSKSLICLLCSALHALVVVGVGVENLALASRTCIWIQSCICTIDTYVLELVNTIFVSVILYQQVVQVSFVLPYNSSWSFRYPPSWLIKIFTLCSVLLIIVEGQLSFSQLVSQSVS